MQCGDRFTMAAAVVTAARCCEIVVHEDGTHVIHNKDADKVDGWYANDFASVRPKIISCDTA